MLKNFNHAVGDLQKCYFHTFDFQVFLFFSDCNLLQSIFIKAFNSGFIATLFPNLVLFLCWKASRSLQRAFLLCQVTLARFPRSALLYSWVSKSAVLTVPHCPRSALLYSWCPSLLWSACSCPILQLYSTHDVRSLHNQNSKRRSCKLSVLLLIFTPDPLWKNFTVSSLRPGFWVHFGPTAVQHRQGP